MGSDGSGIEGIRSILFGLFPHADHTPEAEAAACGAVLDLAAGCGLRHLTVRAYAGQLRTPFSLAPGFSASLVETENRKAVERAEAVIGRARQTFSGLAADRDIATRQGATEDMLAAFVRSARVHDLTVVTADSYPLAPGRAAAEEALFGAGRPILVLPQAHERFRLRRVTLAWDGSARAARAAHDGLPFFRAAGEVDIVCVVESRKADAIEGSEAARLLAHHDIRVNVSTLTPKDGDIGATIADHAVLTASDLIVMGGYGHSRWREFVLGGVTQTLLEKPPLPVLMAY